jgi:hypothetical protein
MPTETDEKRARAERIFTAREQRKADAPKAVHDYYAAQDALRERTRQLREERLAREANQKKDQSEPKIRRTRASDR